MNLFGKDLRNELAFIAEIGVNHEGDVEKASTMLKLAAESGANAVKFQSYTPSRFISSDDAERLDRVARFGLDEAAHRRLAAEAVELGVGFFSAAISEDWIPILSKLCPAIKIASGDLTFEPVIRAAAATGKPVILSTGCSAVDEIDQAVSWFEDEVGKEQLADHLALMHCVSSYPTPIEQANVRSVPFLAERYGLVTGYSNHVIGADACLAAVALGASLIEVHFTDNKTGRDFRDHELSFEPEDIATLINNATRIRQSLGLVGKVPQECEVGAKDAMRKGLVAATNLSAGKVLTETDIAFARPATEFASSEIGDVIGRTLKENLAAGKTIRRDVVV